MLYQVLKVEVISTVTVKTVTIQSLKRNPRVKDREEPNDYSLGILNETYAMPGNKSIKHKLLSEPRCTTRLKPTIYGKMIHPINSYYRKTI